MSVDQSIGRRGGNFSQSNYKPRVRELPSPKLPDLSLPPPTLKDFAGFETYQRYKDPEVHPEYDNALFLKGIGKEQGADILFLAACPYKEDADDSTSEPRLLKSNVGGMFRRACLSAGIDLDDEYFTTVCKYALPDKQRNKPSAADIKYCSELLEEEIRQVSPKIIVCIGREAVQSVLERIIGLNRIEECWTFSQKYNTQVFVISSIENAYNKPEYYDKLLKELEVVNRTRLIRTSVIADDTIERKYECIETYAKLDEWLTAMESGGYTLFAVDCEWRGQSYVDGNLRSIQFCWKPGHAVYLNLFNETNTYVFDKSYDDVKLRLQKFFNRRDIKYYGHNFCADAVWMSNHLGLEVYGRCILDTMYAFLTFNEYEDLLLKKLAAKYTDLGRYDVDLVMWFADRFKTAAAKPESLIKGDGETEEESTPTTSDDSATVKKPDGLDDEGYGSVPTSILFPYGCADADATFRLAGIALDGLIKDDTLTYYITIKHPFVTDGYASMMEAGVPFNIPYSNKARISYLACSEIMQVVLRIMLKDEAVELLEREMTSLGINDADQRILIKNLTVDTSFSVEDVVACLKKLYDRKLVFSLVPYIRHLKFIDTFNPASSKQKLEWLYTLKRLQPVKTTKTGNGYAMDWDKVLLLPKKEQENYTPATDHDTLKVFADNGDNICEHLIEMNAITTILKTFLKGEEGGIQKFVSSDGRVHCNFAMTVSNRPRSFKPNILNIPRYVTDTIKSAFRKIYKYLGVEVIDKGGGKYETDASHYDKEAFTAIVDGLRKKYGIAETITIDDLLPAGIRSCFRAEDGYYFVDADLATAECWAIAYLSNDRKMISSLADPDLQFGLKLNKEGKEVPVRIAYIDEIVPLTDDAKDPALLTDPNDPELLRDENGNLRHPKQDIHWAATENKWFMNTPREKLDKNSTRDAVGKRQNFSVPYGASPALLERSVEVTLGHKPEPGTGQKMIDSYINTKPVAWEWLNQRRQEVLDTHCYKSPTGFKRHYVLPSDDIDMPDRLRNKIISGLQRQNCNIGLQSLVADTLARAVVRINTFFIRHGLKSRVVVPLYDACYILAPIDEVDLAKKCLDKYLSKDNSWDLPGGKLTFGIDVEVTKAWGTQMTPNEKEEFEKLYAETKQADIPLD